MFNAAKLSIARRRRAMSKKSVAGLIGVTSNTMLRYENGEIVPSEEIIEKLSKALNFPLSFFDGPDIDEPRRDNASFRGMGLI